MLCRRASQCTVGRGPGGFPGLLESVVLSVLFPLCLGAQKSRLACQILFVLLEKIIEMVTIQNLQAFLRQFLMFVCQSVSIRLNGFISVVLIAHVEE